MKLLAIVALFAVLTPRLASADTKKSAPVVKSSPSANHSASALHTVTTLHPNGSAAGAVRSVNGTRPGVSSVTSTRPDVPAANGTRPGVTAAGGKGTTAGEGTTGGKDTTGSKDATAGSRSGAGGPASGSHPELHTGESIDAPSGGYQRPGDSLKHAGPDFYGHPLPGLHHYDAWAWHNGSPWVANQAYWGGGFWGPLALGLSAGSLVTVSVDSPGHLILENYGLTPVACGPNGEVELYGPSGSVVCANPTASVPAGNYQIDPSTLQLVPTQEE